MQAMDFMSPSYQDYENHPFLSKTVMVAFWLFYAVGHTKYSNELMKNIHAPLPIRQSLLSGNMNHDLILNNYQSIRYKAMELSQGNSTVWKELEPIFMDPYFAPLMSQDLSNLPAALVFTVEYDILRDDGIWYAEFLRSFSVPVTHVHYEAGFHCMIGWPEHLDEDTLEARGIIAKHIRENL